MSIVTPTAFNDFRESAHNPRAVNNLSRPRPHENITFVENNMDLTSTASVTSGIPPVTTIGEMTTRPSTVFERDSFLPLPNFFLQQRRCDGSPSTRYPSEFGGAVSTTESLPSSHIPQTSASVDNLERFNGSLEGASLLTGHMERGAGAALYSECPMPRGVPRFREPPLMPSAPVAQNSFTATASQASGYGARAEPACSYYNHPVPSSFYYPSGSWSQPLLSSQQSFQHAPEYPPYVGNIPQAFSQIPRVVPPPMVTGFSSASMHSARAFSLTRGDLTSLLPG